MFKLHVLHNQGNTWNLKTTNKICWYLQANMSELFIDITPPFMIYIKTSISSSTFLSKGHLIRQICVALLGNLTLNQSCTTADQCLGLPYASCLGGKCSCTEGYDVSNSSYCVLSIIQFKYYECFIIKFNCFSNFMKIR